jgi:hypothetical protein
MARAKYTTHKILDSKIDKCVGYITALVANSKWEIDKAKLSAKAYYELDVVEHAILNLKFDESMAERPLPKVKAIADYTIAQIESHMQEVTKRPETKIVDRLEAYEAIADKRSAEVIEKQQQRAKFDAHHAAMQPQIDEANARFRAELEAKELSVSTATRASAEKKESILAEKKAAAQARIDEKKASE